MADDAGNPNRQLAAAWQAATAALGEWRQQVSTATSDAMNKLDPAIRAAVEAGRSALSGDWRACRCQCGSAHPDDRDRKSTRLNSSHLVISYAVFCLKKKKKKNKEVCVDNI